VSSREINLRIYSQETSPVPGVNLGPQRPAGQTPSISWLVFVHEVKYVHNCDNNGRHILTLFPFSCPIIVFRIHSVFAVDFAML